MEPNELKETDDKLKNGFQTNRKSKLVGFTVSSREDLERKIVSCYRFVFSCLILVDEKHVNRLVFSSPYRLLHDYFDSASASFLSLPAPLLMLGLSA